MSHANDKAGATPMPVTGGCCGIRPSKEAMEVDFSVDFSKARQLLEDESQLLEKENKADASKQSQSQPNKP